MVLSGIEIEKRLGTQIIIRPFDRRQLNANSYNLRLHNELLVYANDELDMKRPSPTNAIQIPEEGLLIEPRRLYLGRTVEYTETHALVPMLEGRSSIGRLGLSVHATAGFGDVGFRGHWTLEISCIQPVRVYPFVQVCQICYHTIEGEHREYSSDKYQGNDGTQPSLLYRELT